MKGLVSGKTNSVVGYHTTIQPQDMMMAFLNLGQCSRGVCTCVCTCVCVCVAWKYPHIKAPLVCTSLWLVCHIYWAASS